MQQLSKYILLAIAFLLPWQTRWMYAQATVGGEAFELGTMSLYVVELLAIVGLLVVKRGSIRVPRVASWGLLLIALGVISSLWAIDSQLTMTHLVHLVAALSLFVLLFDTKVLTRHIVWAFVLGLIIPTVLGVWQVVVGSSPALTQLGLAARDAQTLGDAVLMVGDERILRAYGTFPHPNIFGGYLVMGLLGVCWLWRAAKEQSRIWLTMIGLILFTGLILTFSRSAWLALIIVVLVVAIRLIVRSIHGWRAWFSVARGVRLGLALCILIVAFLSPLIASRFSFDELVESRSLSERVEQYQTFGTVFAEHWFAGVGLANYTLAIQHADPSREWWEYQPVHNAWALLIGELGLIGFFVAIVIFVWVLRGFKKCPIGHFLNPLTLTVIALFVISLFDHYLWSLWPGLALIAISVGVSTRINQAI